MAITDISISEELKTNAPPIKYRGNEGPKSPQEMEMMMQTSVDDPFYRGGEEDDHSMRMFGKPYKELNADELEEFREEMMRLMNKFSKGPVLPSDEDPINPFGPKPTGPVLPDRQMAAYGGIMGMDGRKQYGIGSFFQKAKDKFVDDIIPNEIKENPLLTAALVAGGADLTRGDNSLIRKGLGSVTDFLLGKKSQSSTSDGGTVYEGDRTGGALEKITGIKTGENRTLGGDILGSISKNIVPIVGGLTAGLFTKNTESDTPGLPSDTTALQLADLTKSANLLNQKQGLAAGLNFLPTVASRKYSPEEMAITYAQAANGGRIGYANGGGGTQFELPFGKPDFFIGKGKNKKAIYKQKDGTSLVVPIGLDNLPSYAQGGRIGFDMGGDVSDRAQKYFDYIKEMDEMGVEPISVEEFNKMLDGLTENKANGGRIGRAEGGIMDLGGMEKDYRAEGGFVPIGREEKADDVPARLSVNEFVFTADAVRNAGGGDIDQGAKVMENMMKHLEAGGQVSEESQGMAGARDMFEVSERLSEVV